MENTQKMTTIYEDALSRRKAFEDFDAVSLYRLIERLESDIKNIQEEISGIKLDFTNYNQTVDENDSITKEAIKSNKLILKIKEEQFEELKTDLVLAERLFKEKMSDTSGFIGQNGKLTIQ